MLEKQTENSEAIRLLREETFKRDDKTRYTAKARMVLQFEIYGAQGREFSH